MHGFRISATSIRTDLSALKAPSMPLRLAVSGGGGEQAVLTKDISGRKSAGRKHGQGRLFLSPSTGCLAIPDIRPDHQPKTKDFGCSGSLLPVVPGLRTPLRTA
jgi:hypothetical protein